MKNQNKYKNFGLSKETVDVIISTICKNKTIEKVVLFGSRAKGDYKKGSDIDIAVFFTFFEL